jgi:hypothetical protein
MNLRYASRTVGGLAAWTSWEVGMSDLEGVRYVVTGRLVCVGRVLAFVLVVALASCHGCSRGETGAGARRAQDAHMRRSMLEPQTTPATQRIGGVREFDFDESGRIGFVRCNKDKSYDLVLLETNGHVVSEIRLPAEENKHEAEPIFAFCGHDRWIVAVSTYFGKTPARAWWVNTGQGTVEPIQEPICVAARAVAGTGDGGFVLLCEHPHGSTSDEELVRCDAAAKVLWRIKKDINHPTRHFMIDDVAVTTKGQIAVLDDIPDSVRFFGMDGRYVGAIDLEEAWHQQPDYPAHIDADADGGVIVHDYLATPPIWRMSADGRVVGKLEPRDRAGHALKLFAGLKRAPDGRLWGCDGQSLYRLDDSGVVDYTLP